MVNLIFTYMYICKCFLAAKGEAQEATMRGVCGSVVKLRSMSRPVEGQVKVR